MKSLKVVLIILAVIIIVPLLGYAGWMIKKGKMMDIMVINKSMINFNGSENESLNYLLNKEKIISPYEKQYDLKNEYFGLFWFKDDYRVLYPRLKDVSETARKTDMVYYADAFGIRTGQLKNVDTNKPGKLEYGGINNTDYNFIKELMAGDKYTVLECTFFAPPTEPLVRYNLEKLTDIYYVGWNGIYMADLTEEPDCYMEKSCRQMYLDYRGQEWDFKGPGIVFFNEDARRVVVLEEGKDIQTTDGLIVSVSAGKDEFNLPESVNYIGGFSVLHPGRNNSLSFFELNPTDEGQRKLNESGIPSKFPALIQADNHMFCMAGDFGKNNVNMLLSRSSGVNSLVSAIKGNSKSASNFYHSYYQPFMKNIVYKAYEMKEE